MSKPLLFDKSLDKLSVLFRYSGMNLQKKIVTPMEIIKHRWLYVLNFMVVFSASIASIYFIILGIITGKSFIEITSVAPCLTFAILAMIKSIYHQMNEKHVKELIDLLRYLEIKENNRENCIEKEDIIDNEMKFLNKVINVLYICVKLLNDSRV